jgi:Putative metallopeptidase
MKRVMRAAMLAALICPVVHAVPALAQAPSDVQNPQIEIAYVAPSNAALRPVSERLKNARVLEQLKQFLAPLKLSRKLTVQFDQCGAPTRPYKPEGPATICYELVDQIERVAAKATPNMRQSVVVGTVVQAALHEVSLGVFDILGVPIWGRRNDAADMLAGLIMLQFGEDVARQTIIGTAVFFELSGKTWTGNAFADVNSPEAQRYFNYLCIAYGGKPKSFEFLAKAEGDKKAIIPENRAVRCEREYEQIRKAFNLRIMPYVDPDMLVKVRSMQWLTAGAQR